MKKKKNLWMAIIFVACGDSRSNIQLKYFLFQWT